MLLQDDGLDVGESFYGRGKRDYKCQRSIIVGHMSYATRELSLVEPLGDAVESGVGRARVFRVVLELVLDVPASE